MWAHKFKLTAVAWLAYFCGKAVGTLGWLDGLALSAFLIVSCWWAFEAGREG